MKTLYLRARTPLMKQVLIILVGLCAIAGAEALAQNLDEYNQRKDDLAELATIFGELHHIRRQCEPRIEANVWRERMKRLIALEEPQTDVHEEMVANFNRGYRRAQNRFDYCDRRARDYAAARARDGEMIVARLTQPLQRAVESDRAQPFLWRRSESEAIDDQD